MARWKTSYPSPLSLELQNGEVVYTNGDAPLQRYAAVVLREDLSLLGALTAGFDFEAQVEVEAALLEEALSSGDRLSLRGDISLVGRRGVPRYFSDNMGRGASTYNIWLRGRQLTIDVRDQPRLEITFQTFLSVGFSEASAALIGSRASEIIDAVRQLELLPCFCGTGAETPEQHGNLKTLVSRQHPQASCEHLVTVGRCAVCGRGWIFIKSGDSHYSYSFQVRAFPPG